MYLFRTFLFYLTLLAATVILGLLAIVTALILRKPKWAHRYGTIWARLILLASGVKIKVLGRENFNINQSYIFAANHASEFDIFALYIAIPSQFRWLAKVELFRIPILGQAMKAIGYIPIDRANRKTAFKSIDEAAKKVKEGTSIIIFPEGTRSTDGRLHSFKKGGFILAIKSGQPVVPVSICGSQHILPKNSRMIKPGEISVHFGKPISTSQMNVKDRNLLINEVYTEILNNLPPDQRVQLTEI